MFDLSEFFEIQMRLLAGVPGTRRQVFSDKINWETRLLGIIGARGTGKTTLLLQHLADQEDKRQEHLYILADHVRVQAEGLYDIAAAFFKLGGRSLLIDEIHKVHEWPRVLKSLFDSFPDAKIAFSGSSTLALWAGGADLSRRAVIYALPGLSFREYLMLAEGVNFPPIELPELLGRHAQLAAALADSGPILRYFAEYLSHGVYPYFLEGINEYLPRLMNVLEKVFYEDIPLLIGIKISKIPVIKKMLWLMATSQPFTPNIDKMSRDLKISKEYVYTYLEALERARLISGIPPAESGYRRVRKPSKIYLENTNLLQALAGQGVGGLKQGTVRETFFAQQLMGIGLSLHVPHHGDFLVAERYIFEIGGKSKGISQITGEENAYLVRDDIEAGHGNVIPLWLFGFLY